jgi:hypothetical protein
VVVLCDRGLIVELADINPSTCFVSFGLVVVFVRDCSRVGSKVNIHHTKESQSPAQLT